MTPLTYQLPNQFLTCPVRIDLVGCGGTGSHVLSGLARIHVSLRSLGHPHGFNVTVFDPDRVSETNVGRQLFFRSDVGQYKADVLVNRINAAYGTKWKANPIKYEDCEPGVMGPHIGSPGITIGCVDSAKARVEISKQFPLANFLWLDFGNTAKTGQVVLGEAFDPKSKRPQLPTVLDLFPEMKRKRRKEDAGPSCSLAGALSSQDLFINQAIATLGLNMLWNLFREGSLKYHGLFLNLETGSLSYMPISEEYWARMMGDKFKPIHAHVE